MTTPGQDSYTMAFGMFVGILLDQSLWFSLESYFIFAGIDSKKRGELKIWKTFRLISLVMGPCKLLANVLANRLNTVVVEVVLDNQHAFNQGRQICSLLMRC